MPTFTGKPFSGFYKNIPNINQSSNTGVDSTTRVLHDGAGNSFSISLSDDVLSVQPINDNTTGTFLVKNQSGSNILAVDTSTSSGGSTVKCGSSQINALTQYQYFQTSRLVPVAGSHMVLPLGSASYISTPVEIVMGTGANPDTTFDVSATDDSLNIAHLYWYLPDAITVDAVHVLMGGGSVATSANLNFQLYSYALDTSTNHGDLSDGTLVAGTVGAGGSFVSDVHQDAVKYQSLANVPTDVAAGRVIVATVESTGTDNIGINMTVKYHIQ